MDNLEKRELRFKWNNKEYSFWYSSNVREDKIRHLTVEYVKSGAEIKRETWIEFLIENGFEAKAARSPSVPDVIKKVR